MDAFTNISDSENNFYVKVEVRKHDLRKLCFSKLSELYCTCQFKGERSRTDNGGVIRELSLEYNFLVKKYKQRHMVDCMAWTLFVNLMGRMNYKTISSLQPRITPTGGGEGVRLTHPGRVNIPFLSGSFQNKQLCDGDSAKLDAYRGHKSDTR